MCAPIKDNIQPLIDKSSNEIPRKNAKKAERRIKREKKEKEKQTKANQANI